MLFHGNANKQKAEMICKRLINVKNTKFGIILDAPFRIFFLV